MSTLLNTDINNKHNTKELVNNKDIKLETKPLLNSGLIAGTIDKLGIEAIVDSYIGKVGSHVKINSGAIVKALVIQLLSAPFQSLYGTSEFFSHTPIDKILGSNIKAEDLNRHVLSRLLDEIDAIGPEKLFIKCAKSACDAFNIKVTTGQIDSTSFHYDGQSREEEGCNLILKKGYSRDHRPELNQVILLGLVDGFSKFPLLFKTESGNVQDKTSFKNLISTYWDDLKSQFKELKYLVADSALCTTDIFKEAREKGIYLVTRVPDSSEVFKKFISQYKESDLEPIFDNENCHVFGKFCGTDIVAGEKVKLLLVSNTKMRKQKTDTINKRANKELEEVTQKLKKLYTQPKKCRKDAEVEVNKIISKLKYCSVSDVTYTDVTKNLTKGRPPKGQEPEKKVVAVKVKANVSINQTLVDKAIEHELQFMIVTTDTSRKWSMHDLYSCYMRQSVIERKWRICKKPNIMIDAIYLKSPRRINALMWIMSIALLVYAATELQVRSSMQENNLSIPTPDHKDTLTTPTLDRFNQYLSNLHISVVSLNGKVFISGVTDTLISVINAMGEYWSKYFQSSFYEEPDS